MNQWMRQRGTCHAHNAVKGGRVKLIMRSCHERNGMEETETILRVMRQSGTCRQTSWRSQSLYLSLSLSLSISLFSVCLSVSLCLSFFLSLFLSLARFLFLCTCVHMQQTEGGDDEVRVVRSRGALLL